jgi:hypothetical protein
MLRAFSAAPVVAEEIGWQEELLDEGSSKVVTLGASLCTAS